MTFIPTQTDRKYGKTQKLVEAFETLQRSMWNDQWSIVNSLRNIKVLAVINAVIVACTFVGAASYPVVTMSGSMRQDTVAGSQVVFCGHCTEMCELERAHFGLRLNACLIVYNNPNCIQ